jgi:hypothetical protein
MPAARKNGGDMFKVKARMFDGTWLLMGIGTWEECGKIIIDLEKRGYETILL